MLTLPLSLTAVLYLILIWLPGHRAIRQTAEEINLKQQYVSNAAASAMSLLAAQQKLAKVQAVVEQWRKCAPSEKKLPEFFGKINTLAEKAGVTVVCFDPQSTTALQQISEKSIAVSCTGQFFQIYDFIRSIEQLPTTIWLNSVKIEKMQNSDKNVQCDMLLEFFFENTENSDCTKSAN